MARLSDRDLDDLKARNPASEVAARFVRLRRAGRKQIGPCPVCSKSADSRTDGRFEADGEGWVCAVCCDGGDVIKLIMKVKGIDFRAAVEDLGGVTASTETPATARRRGERDFGRGIARDVVPDDLAADGALASAWREGWLKADEKERASAFYREQERKRLYGMWARGLAWLDTPVESYLERRGVFLPRHPGILLRFAPEMPFFHGEEEDDRGHRNPVMIHRGSAMLAPIIGLDGRFAGLHVTWIDLSQAKGKAVIIDPKTGEVLLSKKVRGSKKGGRIEIIRHPAPRELFTGEGIETVGGAFTGLARAGRYADDMAFWTSVDLGNLGGRSMGTVAHPALKQPNGRPQRVPGDAPDLSEPAMPVPECVTRITYLGDGDSDRLLTENAIRRAAARNARPGREQLVAWPGEGLDFGDLAMEAAR